jgi:hypothetical protein
MKAQGFLEIQTRVEAFLKTISAKKQNSLL